MKITKMLILGALGIMLMSCTTAAQRQACVKTCLDENYVYEDVNKFTCECKEKENPKENVFEYDY